MVLADTECVDPDRIGQHRLFNDIAEHACLRSERPVRIASDVTERIQTELERRHGSNCTMPLTMPTATARRRQNRLLALVLGGVATAVVLVLAVATPEASLPVGDLIVALRLRDHVVAGPPLVDRPIVADFDEQGRLYVADSSGSNDKVEKQLAKKPHRIVRLEDTDGDGRVRQERPSSPTR